MNFRETRTRKAEDRAIKGFVLLHHGIRNLDLQICGSHHCLLSLFHLWISAMPSFWLEQLQLSVELNPYNLFKLWLQLPLDRPSHLQEVWDPTFQLHPNIGIAFWNTLFGFELPRSSFFSLCCCISCGIFCLLWQPPNEYSYLSTFTVAPSRQVSGTNGRKAFQILVHLAAPQE